MNIYLETKDGITPSIAKKVRALRDTTKFMQAVGRQGVSLAKRAFTETELRPTAWAPKRDGSDATLIKTTTLRRSIRSVIVGSVVWIGSDRKYARIHQLGGTIKRGSKAVGTMPARPYMPFDVTGTATAEFVRKIDGIATRLLKAEG